MNPSLGLLLPLVFGQPPSPPPAVVPASGFAHMKAAAPGCNSCPTPAMAGPRMPTAMFPPYAPPQQVCPPVGPPAPVLAMKAVLPDGATIAVDPSGTGYAGGSVFGFRPGYVYRLKVNVPGREPLGATLEVRGSIVPRANMKYMEFPAALHMSKTDVARVTAAGVVTKVIYLENPEKAIPQEELPGQPLEVAADSEREALDVAGDNGRIVAVLRIGDRTPTADEMTRWSIDGTVLLPGQGKLGLPGVPPLFGCSPVPLYDPILGPKPLKEECFPNGGDGGPRIGIGPDGRLGNLDPTDAAAEYTRGGRREAAVSNVVCLCSPRFVARRAEAAATRYTTTATPAVANQFVARSVFRQRAYAEELLTRERTLGLDGRMRPAAVLELDVLHALGSKIRTQAFVLVNGVQQVAAVVEPDEINNFPTRLVLTKSVEPAGPYKPGDVVTITLKYANYTRQAVTDLVVSDSLSGRLEYLDGTAMSDRPSNVTTADNEAGSKVVRFDIPGPIPPGGTGVVVFQVKVR